MRRDTEDYDRQLNGLKNVGAFAEEGRKLRICYLVVCVRREIRGN